MPRGDPLHLQILGRIAGQLKHLSGEVLKDGRAVDSRGGSNSPGGEGPALQMTVDPADGETGVQPWRSLKPPSASPFRSPFLPFLQPS